MVNTWLLRGLGMLTMVNPWRQQLRDQILEVGGKQRKKHAGGKTLLQ